MTPSTAGVPEGVSLYAVSEQEPGVKLQVMTTVFSPSQAGCSAIIPACVQISWQTIIIV